SPRRTTPSRVSSAGRPSMASATPLSKRNLKACLQLHAASEKTSRNASTPTLIPNSFSTEKTNEVAFASCCCSRAPGGSWPSAPAEGQGSPNCSDGLNGIVTRQTEREAQCPSVECPSTRSAAAE